MWAPGAHIATIPANRVQRESCSAASPCTVLQDNIMLATAGETMRAKRESAPRRGRAGRRFRTWLACFSLLLQLAATAGHFHREDFTFIAVGKAALPANGVQGTPTQPGGQPTLPAHDDCSLCFSLQLAGASALPAPVVLVVPDEHATVLPSSATALRLTAAAHLLFQTRAPPIA